MEEQAFYIISGNPQSLSTFAPRNVFSISLGCDVHLLLPPQIYASLGYMLRLFYMVFFANPLCCSFGVPSCAAITTCACHAKNTTFCCCKFTLDVYFDGMFATIETPDAKTRTCVSQC